MTNSCAKRPWQFPRGFAVNGHFAVNFRGGFSCKIVPCPGAGHGGYNDISLVSTSASKGVSKKANVAHMSRFIGCERNICDGESPVEIVDSSSLSRWNFRANSSMSQGGT